MAPIDLFDTVAESNERDIKGKGRAKQQTENGFKFNEQYAEKYETRKRGEELTKLKDKYGEGYEEESEDEDLSSEDSDAEFITPEVDAAILKTLARIKRSDPTLYEGDQPVFQEEESQHSAARANRAKKKNDDESAHRQKPLHLRDYHRQNLLSGKDAKFDDGSEEKRNFDPTPAEEAEILREETKRVFYNATKQGEASEGGSSDEVEDLLIPREKTLDEAEKDEEDYQNFLLEQVGREDLRVAFESLAEPSDAVKPNEDDMAEDDETFLKNYVLGRGWIDKEAKKIPKYAEIVKSEGRRHQSDSTNPTVKSQALGRTLIDETQDDDEDEEFVEKAEEFEAKYNFRFEDAAQTIVTHARDMDHSVRRTDDARKTARAAAKARKREEKQQKMDELNRLKELKRTALMAKLDVIKKNAGAEDFNLDDFDLESDFDPDSHDRRMCNAFNNEFYGQEDPEGKPVWEDDIDIDDIIPPQDYEADDTQIDFEPGGDAYDPLAPAPKGSKRQKKREKKQSKKQKFIGETLGEELGAEERDVELERELVDLEALPPDERKKRMLDALDEYHKLDYEDLIGDLPTRFKYTKVEPDPLNITPAEILMATDAELNDIIGLGKLAPYRTEPDKKSTTRKKKLKELRGRLKDRTWGEAHQTGPSDSSALNKYGKRSAAQLGDGDQAPPKKRKGKKERQKQKHKSEVDMQIGTVAT
ncbi:KRI1-like family-domain-containing protein [Melampsora americana]|nr:KRI1-like family-domain-containing protein [Melampsora americana]